MFCSFFIITIKMKNKKKKKSLKEREQLFIEKDNSSETAEASYRIRCSIKAVRENANTLKEMAYKTERKV